MTKENILAILRSQIGISTGRQDERLSLLIDSIVEELKEHQGITLDYLTRTDHAMFLIDYAEYRYSDMKAPMPEHLRWRLRNLFVGEGKPNAI